ncbi:MAG TPA: hypothetical protein VGE07_16095 [Herpetosiphonaceae bacterium]
MESISIAPRGVAGSGAFAALVPQLIEIASAGAPHDQYRALSALASIGPDAAPALPLLIELLGKSAYDGSPNADEAVRVLGAIGPAAAGAVPSLIDLLASADQRSDYAPGMAPWALARIGDLRAIPALMAAAAREVDFQGPGLRAIDALRDFGRQAREAAPLLLGLLADERYGDYRHALIAALVEIGPANGPAWEVCRAALAAAKDESGRQDAAQQLYRLLFSGGPPHPAARELFAALAADPDPEVRHQGRIALDVLDRGAAG